MHVMTHNCVARSYLGMDGEMKTPIIFFPGLIPNENDINKCAEIYIDLIFLSKDI